MKNFIKLFFIILSFFISLGTGNCSAQDCDVRIISLNTYSQEIIDDINIPREEVLITPVKNESYLVPTNSRNYKITPANDKKDSYSRGSLDKTSNQNKLFQQIFYNKYNQLFLSTSHKISSYLQNEICTRAP